VGITWPLTGRREELALFDQALAAPGVSGVVFAGAAGVGKTRLAREALGAAEAAGWTARWAVATRAAASIPFGAVAHLLPAVDVAGHNRFELLRGAAADLVEATGNAMLVLGVDDAHLLDDASAALVHQLAATASGFVVATVRSGAPAPDWVVALWKDGLAERLEVQALGRGEVEKLVSAALRGQVDGTTLRDLWQLTDGNPMFLRELILGGLDSSALRQEGGVWRWEGPMTAAPRLVELVEARLGRLDPQEHDLLELLAFGEPLGGTLEHMVPAAVLAGAEGKGLLSAEQAGRRLEIRPAHPLYGEVVRAQASLLRVRLVQRRLAEAVEATGARRTGDLLRIVTWRLDVGLSSPPEQLTVGARHAMALFDYELAERLARAAVDAGGGLAAEYLVGETLLALGRVAEADLVLEGLAPRGTTDAERTQVAITRAFTLYWALNLPAQARAVLQRAQDEVTERGSRDELDTILASFVLYGGSCTDALRKVAGVLDRPGVGDRTVVQALVVATPALFLNGQIDHAIAAASRGLELARHLGEDAAAPWWQLQLSANLGNAYVAGGRLDEAEALAEKAYQRALGQPWPVEKAIWAGWLGQVFRARGRPRTALHWLREAAAAGQVDLPLPFMPAILGELAHAAALLGDLPAAEAALVGAERFTGESARVFQLWAASARPWVAAARGELSSAVTLALDLAKQAETGGQVTFRILALHDVARLGQPRRVAPALRDAVLGVEGHLAPIYAAHATALLAQDGAALDEVASSFASIGVNLLAAEAAAEAAHAYRAAGRHSSALAAARMATALAAACEGAHTPALDLLDRPPELTPREQEIAGLAARGLSSRAIAERLVISIRTVDNALQHVYGKLGLTSRTELRVALNRPDPAPTDHPSE
jgi:DNA-binding CsgD family transcriptional regulator